MHKKEESGKGEFTGRGKEKRRQNKIRKIKGELEEVTGIGREREQQGRNRSQLNWVGVGYGECVASPVTGQASTRQRRGGRWGLEQGKGRARLIREMTLAS